MRTLYAFLLAGLLIATPAASATGYLVNVGIGSSSFTFGANVFGGSGDTVDVGLLNEQCTDEADFLDVGIANAEGTNSRNCQADDRCAHERGEDPLKPFGVTPLVQPEAGETPARCGDTDDTIDVGVLNREGTHRDFVCDPEACYEGGPRGDERDATDVGVLNEETGDDDDGNDAGVLNCEWSDRRDSTDLSLLNLEFEDGSDTFDLSVLSFEWNEGGDANGLAVGGGAHPGFGCAHLDVATLLG